MLKPFSYMIAFRIFSCLTLRVISNSQCNIYIYICLVLACGMYDKFENRMTSFNSKK